LAVGAFRLRSYVTVQDWKRDFVKFLPLVGLGVTALEIVAWLGLRARDPDAAHAVAQGIGALFLSGKEGGLPTAISAGASAVEAGLYLFGADLAFTLFVYPPIHYAMFRWMEGRGFVARFLREAHVKAEKHEAFVDRFGAAGLFMFMLVPFVVNGPVVGAILGRIVGLSAVVIVPTLVVAIAFTFVLWTSIYGLGLGLAGTVDPTLPKFIAFSIVALLLAVGLVRFVRARLEERREERA
jgi:uncharacterized membrane protein